MSDSTSSHAHPLRVGAGLALLSASLFGVSTPFVRRFGEHSGPFTTAGLLYVGAALASAALGGRASEAPLRAQHLPRVLGIAVCGAVVAPVCLAWGLLHTSAMLGSLLLTSEALFTVVLARLFYREPIGRRVAGALGFITLGAVLLVHSAGTLSQGAALGSLAVVAASLAWAADNTLTRPLADLDPNQVVFAKSVVGASLSLGFAWHEPHSTLPAELGLVVTGALGYGASLRLYLQAQRRIGAARTGSIFASAPFIGAIAAWCAGDGALDASTVGAGFLVGVGVYLHVSEKHGHEHTHVATEHEHAHRHDDGHHTHAHYPPFEGEHSHPHNHEEASHTHPHGQDLHHRHDH